MRDHALFRLAPTPAHMSDAEISGLYAILESDSSPRSDEECATPASSTDRSSPAEHELGPAFARYARAAAAVLNR